MARTRISNPPMVKTLMTLERLMDSGSDKPGSPMPYTFIVQIPTDGNRFSPWVMGKYLVANTASSNCDSEPTLEVRIWRTLVRAQQDVNQRVEDSGFNHWLNKPSAQIVNTIPSETLGLLHEELDRYEDWNEELTQALDKAHGTLSNDEQVEFDIDARQNYGRLVQVLGKVVHRRVQPVPVYEEHIKNEAPHE